MTASVRFGWINRVHASIQDGATTLLNSDKDATDLPLFRFLDRYNDQYIHFFSDKEDIEHETGDSYKGHFLDVEELWQSENCAGSTCHVPQQVFNFGDIKKMFSSENRAKRVKYFRDNPMDYETVEGLSQPNVVASVVKNYNRLVGQLRDFPQELADGKGKREIVKELCRTIGKLSHYVGDLHNPMHNTYAEWSLSNSSKFDKAHLTIDGVNLMSDDDCQVWESSFNKHGPASFKPAQWSLDQIKQRLAHAVELGYLLVYDIAHADSDARDSSRNGNGNVSRPLYTEKLEQAWRPLVEEQMSSAALMTANIFRSAFAEAGKPNLDLLV